MRSRFYLVLLVGASACHASTPEASLDESPIIGGTPARRDPAVIAITRAGSPHCTGTVIAPRGVLTAAHCVRSYDFRELRALFFAPSVQDPGPHARQARFSRAFVHGRYPDDVTSDLALLELEETAPVAPVAVLKTALDESVVGRPMRVVGFGRTAPDEPAGAKMEGVAAILELQERRIVHAPNTCPGDSGGPGFLTIDGREVLVGVHSTGSCGVGDPSTKVRVDRNLDFISFDADRDVEPIAVPQSAPPPPLPALLHATLEGRRGSTFAHAIRCPPRTSSLSISLGKGVTSFLRFERPATPTQFDFSVPGGSVLTTESDGTAFPPGTWHVLTRADVDVNGATLDVDCH